MQQKNHLLTNLGQAISRRRHERRLTQEGLAKKSELHRSYICDVERGRRNLSISTLAVIAEALDTTVSELTAKIDAKITLWLTSAASIANTLFDIICCT